MTGPVVATKIVQAWADTLDRHEGQYPSNREELTALIAAALEAAFKAGFCAHYGKRVGDWVFDAETCAAGDLYPQALAAWKAGS